MRLDDFIGQEDTRPAEIYYVLAADCSRHGPFSSPRRKARVLYQTREISTAAGVKASSLVGIYVPLRRRRFSAMRRFVYHGIKLSRHEMPSIYHARWAAQGLYYLCDVATARYAGSAAGATEIRHDATLSNTA